MPSMQRRRTPILKTPPPPKAALVKGSTLSTIIEPIILPTYEEKDPDIPKDKSSKKDDELKNSKPPRGSSIYRSETLTR
ncbi:hypothetical protein HDU67_005237, partial [Dinochytrium kinnereticum]